MKRKKRKLNKNVKYIFLGLIMALLSLFSLTGNFENLNWKNIFSNFKVSDQSEPTDEDFNMSVHFMNVGKADCAYIKCKNHSILIDAADKEPYGTVTEYLKKQGVSKLDLVVISHPHRDHIGQMAEVIKEFKEKNQKLYSAGWKSQFMGGFMYPVMNFISNLGYVAVAIVGGYFVINGQIQVGDIQSFVQYNKQFTRPIGEIAQVMTQIQTMIAALERVLKFLDEEEEKDAVSNPVDVDSLKGNIKFEHVKFGYNPDKIVINDFNADVKDGQKIAIVGPTGAGKTTLVKLLMRFYDLNDGKITIDGYDIKDFKKGDLRKHFGMVLQDTWLFSGTIKDNIKYSKPDATDDEVIEAAKAAHVHHFIKTLPNSYNMVLNEETSNISAGQKQLLTIARVILADPKILILDEATSSIDTRTEIQIQAAMDNLMKGRTSFIIAHRLSTIKNADMILVINNGDIVEQGTHDELLAKDGFYATLYNSQFDEEEE